MERSAVKNTIIMLLLVLTAWAYTYYDALVHMVTVWSHSETYKHCFFIPFIVGYLVHQKRHFIHSHQAKPVWWLLAPLVLVQIGFTLVTELQINLFMHISAYIALVISVWAVLGHKVTRVIAFPLLYLAFCVPVGEELVPLLQEITADIGVTLLQVFGIPVFREGLYLHVPNGTFLVAEACAGIRFLIGTFAIGVLLAYLNYQKLSKRLIFSSICLVVPVIANGIRAFGIMVIGYLSDMKYATGADHLVYGWVFFAIVTVLILWLGTFYNDPEPRPEDVGSNVATPAQHTATHTSTPWMHIVSLLVGLLLPVMALNAVLKATSDASVRQPFVNMNQLFSKVQQSPTGWSAPTTDKIWTGKLNGIESRLIYVNESTYGKELVSSRHRVFDDERWSQKSLKRITINGIPVFSAKVVNVRGASKNLIAWYQIEGLQSYSAWQVKVTQLLNKLTNKSSDGFFIVIEVGNRSEQEIADLMAQYARLSAH